MPRALTASAPIAGDSRPRSRWRASFPDSLLLPALLVLASITGCASGPATVDTPAVAPAIARARVLQVLPREASDRAGWATDIVAAFASMEIEPSPQHLCAVIAVTEQESGFRADPSVPGLANIARREIDRRAERAGIPKLLVRSALGLSSPTGKTYAERLDAARTERELSEIFQDFIGIVPMGRTLFAGWNPVRTGGPMQVGIDFAERHAKERPYPYPLRDSVRDEVFTRRGGLYFGIAHLLDYPASYERLVYRFADFNAGHYASRNAAFQNAVSSASGIPLALDGDLLPPQTAGADTPPGSTELATRVLAKRLDLSESDIRRALALGPRAEFERTDLYERVYELADRLEGSPLPRAMLPRIALESPKITRPLTTAWFANRVEDRFQRCLKRGGAGAG